MAYMKPKVRVLGRASAVIEQITQKPLPKVDGHPLNGTGPAYDLDE